MNIRPKLSASLFESIVRNMKSDGMRDKDKRAHMRVGISYKIDIMTVHANGRRTVWQIQLRDISASGLGLIVHQKMPIGEQFIIELATDDGPVWIVGTVVRCTKAGESAYIVGARHTKVLRDTGFEVIAAELAASAKTKLANGTPSRGSMKSAGSKDPELVERIRHAILDDPPGEVERN